MFVYILHAGRCVDVSFCPIICHRKVCDTFEQLSKGSKGFQNVVLGMYTILQPQLQIFCHWL